MCVVNTRGRPLQVMWGFCSSIESLWYISGDLHWVKRHTETYFRVKKNHFISSSILYLCHFSVESHKIKMVLESWGFQSLSICLCLLFVICLRFSAIWGQGLLFSRYHHLYLSSSCLISHFVLFFLSFG